MGGDTGPPSLGLKRLVLHKMNWDELALQIDRAMLQDRHRFRRWLRSLRRGGPSKALQQETLTQLTQQLDLSCQRRNDREKNRPDLTWDAQLPITSHRDAIAQAIVNHPVVILCGETGSGKSTQIPKICLSLGRGTAGLIGHTQPRRIAARSIAARLADELKSAVGQAVGYKVRFQDTVSAGSYIKLMTDGILLAETDHDPFLEQYDTLIIDEAHERSLNIDFLLGYLHRLLPKRRDLRIVIASATLDAEKFAAYFSHGTHPAPIIEVSGRGFPVETRYRPLPLDTSEDPFVDIESNETLHQAIAAALDELLVDGPGDILVFLPTERSIREAHRYLRGWALHQANRCEILPLYARLSSAEQNRIFQRGELRRIVLSTNVAESSLTVPGIRYVIDSGTARTSRYSPRLQLQRLPIERVSQAAANQRQGRCGREAPGICIRLYEEEDFVLRDKFATPEIRRTNLAGVVLRLLSLRWGNVDEFPFLDAPRQESVRDGFRTLEELEAIDDEGRLTEIGREMSRMPVDPRIARIILAGKERGCLQEALILAAALEVQDPRLRPPQREMLADEQHARFEHPNSDFISYLQLWDHLHDLKHSLSKNQYKRSMTQQFLSHARVLEWQDVHVQLKQVAADRGWKLNSRHLPTDESYESIHRALATGLLAHIGMLKTRNEYEICGGGISYLWPGAGPFRTRPKWVIAAELVETSRRYLRCVARVEPEWIEQAADHLVVREYSDPSWSRKLGTVIATERVRWRGLQLASRRSTDYGRVDPGTARRLFIQHALIEGDFRATFDFLERNQELVQSLASLAARSRDPGLLVPNAIQFAFYDERIPDSVFDTHTLHRWIKKFPTAAIELIMQRQDILPDHERGARDLSAYPIQVQVGPLRVNVSYRFEPQRDDDGISMTVDRDTLAKLEDPLLDWLVPGLLREKITALIRLLPKAKRRNLIPAPDVASQVAERIEFGQGPFLPTIAAVLSEIGGEPIHNTDFDMTQLPPYLRFHLRVVDETGKRLAQGRSADDLRKRLSVAASTTQYFPQLDAWNRDHLQSWDFGDLPDQVEIRLPGGSTTGFPVLVDGGHEVSLRVFHQRAMALQSHERGVRRLCVLAARDRLRAQVAWLPGLEKCDAQFRQLGLQQILVDQLSELLSQLAFLQDQSLPFRQADFEQLMRTGLPRIAECVQDVASIVPEILTMGEKVRDGIASLSDKWSQVRQEAQEHLQHLFTPNFLVETPWPWLKQYPRYLRAVLVRLERLRGGGSSRDETACHEWWQRMRQFCDRFEAHKQRGVVDDALEQYRWMLEEYRVSLFAQELGTMVKVSPQRLDKQWSDVSF